MMTLKKKGEDSLKFLTGFKRNITIRKLVPKVKP